MGIFERLGSVIRSYINDSGIRPGESGKSAGPGGSSGADSDYAAAWEELEGFLKGEGGRARPSGAGNAGTRDAGASRAGGAAGRGAPPEQLRADFAELGVPFGASLEECKAAYKRLLKTHHPDHHAGHSENMKKATEKSARINSAWDRLEKWHLDRKN